MEQMQTVKKYFLIPILILVMQRMEALQFTRATTRTLATLPILHLQQIRQIRLIILSFATDIPSTRSILSMMEIMPTGWHQELRQMHLRM